KAFYVDNIIYADSNVFSVLDFPFVAGNPVTALKEPASVVITEELADKLYGSANAAMGKPVKYISSTLLVTGVVAPNYASHLKPGAFIPLHWDQNTAFYVT